ncbi:MAG: hypothetical protein A2284_05595 [Deltaproteobacteria bacterium RIFOXYA12_FULL_61_11]|nr:MAG: hypothetical protein A2284_05595 [Deltaproteobacteria bacterium RIFOXYA12_FULL_61_11]
MTVLVAEDDQEMLELIENVLTEEGYQVLTANNGTDALAALERRDYDVVVTDLKMPGASGLEVLRRARASYLRQPVVVMTAFGSIETAVQAMKEGAYSYITKPFDLEELLAVMAEIAEQVRAHRQLRDKGESGEAPAFPIVFRSKVFRRVLAIVHEVAESNASVLLGGETGTGKELIARELHLRSSRAKGPFIPVDVNTIPDALFESELFGHKRGAFTGAVQDKPGLLEQADHGTLFLDEIGEMGPAAQAKLLRFLQERRCRRVGDTKEHCVDVRLVSATHRDLSAMIGTGQFREDLFYRLAVIPINLPALRERPEDITPLAYHFLRMFNKGFSVEGFRQDALELLASFPWPGNVRQLENAVEHAVIMRKTGLIKRDDFPAWITTSGNAQHTDLRTLEEVERGYILELLDRCQGNRSKTAKILGINRRTLLRKLAVYNIPPRQ